MRVTSAATLALAALLTLGACAQQNTAATSAAPTAGLVLNGQELRTAKGTFVGKSKHVTTGHASIARLDGKWVVILEDDFTFDGAPDPHVALGANGYRKDASLALLSSNTGQQVYAIPANLDVADFNEIWIWCDQFSVPLGKAPLELL